MAKFNFFHYVFFLKKRQITFYFIKFYTNTEKDNLDKSSVLKILEKVEYHEFNY